MPQLELVADASFIMVLVSVIWLMQASIVKGLPALGKQCFLPDGCHYYDNATSTTDYSDYNDIYSYYEDCTNCNTCTSCYGSFGISGFVDQGEGLLECGRC